jgi:hypothetical protein
MDGFGPSAAIRCATFECGVCAVDEVELAALPVVDVLLAALLLLGEELHPAKPMATAITAIAAPPRAAVRFITTSSCRSGFATGQIIGAFPIQPRSPRSAAAIYAFSLADVEGSTRMAARNT